MANTWRPLFTLVVFVSSIQQLSDAANRTCEEKCSKKHTLRNLQELQGIASPRKVCDLDLSDGGIDYIEPGTFRNFSNLVSLSVTSNKLSSISSGAFAGLNCLRYLNLSMNRIKSFEVSNISTDLPSLAILDMTGNNWLLSNDILLLTSLLEIRGTKLSKMCSECTLIKAKEISTKLENLKKGEYLIYLEGYPCRARAYTVKSLPRTIAKYGFISNCFEEGHKCFEQEIPSEVTYPCWDVTRQVGGLNYLFGPLAIVLNLCVITTTMYSNRLRKNIAMLLVANLAFADFLNGLYSLSITAVRQQRTFQEMLKFTSTSCSYLGFPWMFATELSVNTLFVLAVERFLSIVYSTKPRYRLMLRSCVVVIAVIWIYSLLLAVLPLVGVADYSITLFCVPIYPVKSIPAQFWFSFYVTGTVAITYLVTIPLYVKLYRAVKKSGLRTGKRNDVTLAKRIFILVMCNMFFFFLPVAISLIWSWSGTVRSVSRTATDVLTSAFSIVCLTISSAINPGLYAFQSSSFREELRSLYRRVFGKRIGFRGVGESSASGPSTTVTRDQSRQDTSGICLEVVKAEDLR
ncbi:probable glycoprotein hormone G-protein coupled receptor isoform X2 [Nematostella vectensis]|nr:probable glycoprotein hormone G-protein coupled receptor isoform X2 [Nematostella vectensis]XP_032221543.2 probable glycoprotein hormone G-protein coupled receptor isoform X2 [Nematostella vectensis]XP_048584411.1 probable glycoprotein hormone G-protein coupled receptor isoform X2 [Nematostella vectensis]